MAARESVFDRLSNVKSFTGVYAERFKGNGRINSDTDLSVKNSSVTGSTNNSSDVVVRDISQIMRPNLRTASRSPKKKRDGGANGGKGLDVDTQLRQVFQYYCLFGRTAGSKDEVDSIDNANFAKLARECPGLLDRSLTRTEVDLIFTKAKPKFARRLDYSHFLDALSALAAKKYSGADPTTAFTLLLAHHVLKCPATPRRGSHRGQGAEQQRAPAASAPSGGRKAGAESAWHEEEEEVVIGGGTDHGRHEEESGALPPTAWPPGPATGGGEDGSGPTGPGVMPPPPVPPPQDAGEGEGGYGGYGEERGWSEDGSSEGQGREAPEAASQPGAERRRSPTSEAPPPRSLSELRVPMRPLGFRLVSSGTPLRRADGSEDTPEFPSVVVEAFLEPCCPHSAALYRTAVEAVMPECPAGQVEFVFHPWVQPWRPQGAAMAEVALAVGALDPDAFFPFCSRMFGQQEEFFDDRAHAMSRQDICERLAALAESVGVNPAAVMDAVSPTGQGNCGTAVTQALEFYTRFGRQNGVHAGPTVLVNGLVDDSIRASWSADQWQAYLALFLEEGA